MNYLGVPVGDYVIEFYQRGGQRLPGATATCASLTQAEERAEKLLTQLGAHRYVILRILDRRPHLVGA